MWWYELDWHEKIAWIMDFIDFLWDYDMEEDFIPLIISDIWSGNVDGYINILEARYDEEMRDYEKAQEYIKLFKEYKEA